VRHQNAVAHSGHKSNSNGLRSRLAALLALSLSLVSTAGVARIAASQSSDGGAGAGYVSVAMPASGEVSVENRRGGVRVEVWAEDYVAVSAAMQAPKGSARRKLPVAIERGESSLTIRVERATGARPPRVDLKLRVPASARLKVSTSDGELEIVGVPASLSAQTLSGDLRLSALLPLDASVTAQSLNGTVALGEGVEASGAGARVVRGKFQARLGAGTRAVNLFSGRGRITVAALREATEASASARPFARKPRVDDEQDSGPIAPGPARTPQPAQTPQEVDEDEVVRVESDLVTLNFSVVERASGRGLAGHSREPNTARRMRSRIAPRSRSAS